MKTVRCPICREMKQVTSRGTIIVHTIEHTDGEDMYGKTIPFHLHHGVRAPMKVKRIEVRCQGSDARVVTE